MSQTLEFPLSGAGGEPVDLWRTLNSHGFADLPPMRLDEDSRWLDVVIPLDGARPRRVRIRASRAGIGEAVVFGPRLSAVGEGRLLQTVRHVLRLDEDLSDFYVLASDDSALAWSVSGAGRMLQSPTVFEDVVKTICTTNCAWSATVRMVGGLVEHLGEPAAGAPPDGPYGRAFPTPAAMAEAGEPFYREVARAGYRGAYLIALARSVADGLVDLEALARTSPDALPDEEVERTLLALPGVGPYAAAHIMMTIGRYSRLILDSWTRPKYARLIGKKSVTDEAIRRRFRRLGNYAGLGFWLFLTRDWVAD